MNSPDSPGTALNAEVRRIGGYTLTRRLGYGGMGEVFLGERGAAGKAVAVKVLLPEHRDDPDIVRSFIDEANIASELSHPNIVDVYDFGESDGSYYLAMEYVDGWDLRALTRLAQRRDRRFSLPAAAYILHEVAVALHYVHSHERRIIHRDVTPHNIFITRDGHVKLGDFGVAKAAARVGRTLTGQIKGKLAYLAPEQLRGEEVTQRTDVYALGLMLFELLTNERFNPGRSDSSLLRHALNPKQRRPSKLVPQAAPLDEIVVNALAIHPTLRTRDAGLFADEMEAFLVEQPFDAEALADFSESLFRDEPAETSPLNTAVSDPGPSIAKQAEPQAKREGRLLVAGPPSDKGCDSACKRGDGRESDTVVLSHAAPLARISSATAAPQKRRPTTATEMQNDPGYSAFLEDLSTENAPMAFDVENKTTPETPRSISDNTITPSQSPREASGRTLDRVSSTELVHQGGRTFESIRRMAVLVVLLMGLASAFYWLGRRSAEQQPRSAGKSATALPGALPSKTLHGKVPLSAAPAVDATAARRVPGRALQPGISADGASAEGARADGAKAADAATDSVAPETADANRAPPTGSPDPRPGMKSPVPKPDAKKRRRAITPRSATPRSRRRRRGSAQRGAARKRQPLRDWPEDPAVNDTAKSPPLARSPQPGSAARSAEPKRQDLPPALRVKLTEVVATQRVIASKKGIFAGDVPTLDRLVTEAREAIAGSDSRQATMAVLRLRTAVKRVSLTRSALQRKLARLHRKIAKATLSGGRQRAMDERSRAILRLVMRDRRVAASLKISQALRALRTP